MSLIHLIIMYIALFPMINRGSYFHNNTHMIYMALLLAAPVTLFMVVFTRHAYPNQNLNSAVCIAVALLTVGFYYAIRTQVGGGEKQILWAMIPHYSGATRTYREADAKDTKNATLCKESIESQQREIDQMEGTLKRFYRSLS